MRAYLSVDLEGVNGIVHSSQTQPGEPGYERSIGLMHQETNAVIDGLKKAGVGEILINDAHWDARNLRIELLRPGVQLISGWQKPFSMVTGLDGQFGGQDTKIDTAFFIGYHSRAGTAQGVLSHTYRAQIYKDVKLNGKSVGETGLNAALAGFFGVPIAMISGDDIVCQEAQDLLGEITCVVVKKAVSRYSAVCLPFDETLAKLEAQAQASFENLKRYRVFKVPSPATIQITMVDPAMADGAELMPGVRRTGPVEVEFSHADYPTLFKQFLAVGVLGASRRDPHF